VIDGDVEGRRGGERRRGGGMLIGVGSK